MLCVLFSDFPPLTWPKELFKSYGMKAVIVKGTSLFFSLVMLLLLLMLLTIIIVTNILSLIRKKLLTTFQTLDFQCIFSTLLTAKVENVSANGWLILPKNGNLPFKMHDSMHSHESG